MNERYPVHHLSPSTHRYLPAPPSITSLQSAYVTGTSFCIHWSSQIQTNQTYWVVLSKGSEVIHFWETSQTVMKMMGLQPGVLYNITVMPHVCRSHGLALYVLVRTGKHCLCVLLYTVWSWGYSVCMVQSYDGCSQLIVNYHFYW